MSHIDESVLSRLQHAITVTRTGVTNGFCDRVFTSDSYAELTRAFPDPATFTLVDKNNSGGGRKIFYVGPEYVITRHLGSLYHLRTLPLIWKEVIQEISSLFFMKKLSAVIGTEVNTVCNFGFTFGKEGCMQEPHIDGAMRTSNHSPIKASVAFLLYFNDSDDPCSATEIYDTDRTTILSKGTTMKNSWMFFKQHPNAWHGFPRVPKNHTRRLVSLTYGYLQDPVPLTWSFSGYISSQLRKRLLFKQ